jgi:hypothetical protein
MAESSEETQALGFPKVRREEDPHYIYWIHSWPCCIRECGRWPVQAHHVKTRGAGGSDRCAVPLCADHHVASGKSVHRLGRETFERKNLISLDEQITKFNSLFDAGKKGPYFSLLPAYRPGVLRSS